MLSRNLSTICVVIVYAKHEICVKIFIGWKNIFFQNCSKLPKNHFKFQYSQDNTFFGTSCILNSSMNGCSINVAYFIIWDMNKLDLLLKDDTERPLLTKITFIFRDGCRVFIQSESWGWCKVMNKGAELRLCLWINYIYVLNKYYLLSNQIYLCLFHHCKSA